MKYNVHIYPVCRVKVRGIEASSQAEAIKKADEFIENYSNGGPSGLYCLYPDKSTAKLPEEFDEPTIEIGGFAEDIDGYLVDEEGDTEYARSVAVSDITQAPGYEPGMED